MTDLEKAKELFNDDKFATESTGIEILAVKAEYAKCYLKLQPKHLNANDRVMGGAIFTLADFTFAVAANYDQTPCVTRTSEITFLSQPKGDTLIAESKLIKDGHTACTYQISVNDEFSDPVAIVITNGIKMNQ